MFDGGPRRLPSNYSADLTPQSPRCSSALSSCQPGVPDGLQLHPAPSRRPGPRATSAPRGEACPTLLLPMAFAALLSVHSSPRPAQALSAPGALPLQNSKFWPFCVVLQCFTVQVPVPVPVPVPVSVPGFEFEFEFEFELGFGCESVRVAV